jgi:hypothetical protein
MEHMGRIKAPQSLAKLPVLFILKIHYANLHKSSLFNKKEFSIQVLARGVIRKNLVSAKTEDIL